MNGSMWKEILIGEDRYLISSVLVDHTWKIMLTNLVELWTETLTREHIIQKCQMLNPLLSIEDIDIDRVIGELLSSISQHVSQISTDRISLQNEFEGGIFMFHIDLSKNSPEQFFEEVTKPLCFSITELNRKNRILLREVKKKDDEIFEYKACGAELTSKYTETKKFTDDILKPREIINDITSCIEVFQSTINDNEILRFQGKAIKVESVESISTTESVNSADAESKLEIKKEKPSALIISDTANERGPKKKKLKIDLKDVAAEPEIEIHEMAASDFHLLGWLNESRSSRKMSRKKRGRCSFCPRSCDVKTTATCNNCPSFVCSDHKRIFCIKCVANGFSAG